MTAKGRTALRRTAGILFLAAVAGVIFYFSHQPQIELVPPLFPWQDKALHFAEFFLLGVALYANRGLRPWWGTGFMLAAGSVYALSDEIHQSFVPGRDCSVQDMLADVAGLLISVLLLRWWVGKRRRKG
ncbi:VanZ family protein [Candidatus Fermentibacteria bacterium]|nr:VanZ family protein [Candidatus Fermentibacteria bacterium]